jgi:type III pantothenate kinase
VHPDVVVDVGNSRIKWGRCSAAGVIDAVSLAADDPPAWRAQLQKWQLLPRASWAVSGVNPARRDALIRWLEDEKQAVHRIDSCKQLPLVVAVEQPERVGIDRLLNAVAANARRQAEQPAIIVDAGSAVTVDWVDWTGAFRGGAIFPGLRLMAEALHNHTALLPPVDLPESPPPLPATSTSSAIRAGVFWAAAGGVRSLVEQMSRAGSQPAYVVLTGGDACRLLPALHGIHAVWPNMTLEGIFTAAAGLIAH